MSTYRPREAIEREIKRLNAEYEDLEAEIDDLQRDLKQLDDELSAEEEALKKHVSDPTADALWYAHRDPRQIPLPLERAP